MNKRLLALITLVLAALWLSSPQRAYSTPSLAPSAPLGTGFTYQGFLKNASGNPINSTCDVRFGLWDALSGPTQIGTNSTALGVSVTQGYFNALVNAGGEFGTGAFDNANARWLEVAVKCTGDGSFTVLTPRQPLSRSLPTHDHFGQTWSGSTTGLTLSGGGTGLNAIGGTLGVYASASSTGNAYGVFSVATAATNSTTWGVYGESNSPSGYGVQGKNTATGGMGVNGYNSATTGVTYGVFGESRSPNGYGVYGNNTATFGDAYGVYGRSSSTVGFGVYGNNTATSGRTLGVYGRSSSPDGYGVYGVASATTGYGIGMYAESSSPNGTGVYGIALATTGINYGVFGSTFSSSGYAGYFYGPAYVSGLLTKAGGGFKIDHPLDPANQYLFHSFVESPEMTNIYNDIATLDASGEAVVQMPSWFEALNQDFRYQLTPLGDSMPDLYVAQEIQNNSFMIAGGTPGMRVSWLVTGVRHDPWALANHQEVEQPKPPEQQNLYLHPELYGLTSEQGLFKLPQTTLAQPAPVPAPSLPVLPTPVPETPAQPN